MSKPVVPTSFTYKISAVQAEKLRLALIEKGYQFNEVPYTIFEAFTKKFNVNAYSPGKLLMQGSGAAELMEFVIEPEIFAAARPAAFRIELLGENFEEALATLGAYRELLRGEIDEPTLLRRVKARNQLGVTVS